MFYHYFSESLNSLYAFQKPSCQNLLFFIYPSLFLIRIKQTATLSYNCEDQRTVFLVFQSKVCQYVQKQNYRSCSGCLYFSFVHYHVPVALSVTISAHTHDIYLHRATSRLLLNIITESIFFTISSLDMVNHSGHYICSQSHSLCIQFCCIKVCTPHFEISYSLRATSNWVEYFFTAVPTWKDRLMRQQCPF